MLCRVMGARGWRLLVDIVLARSALARTHALSAGSPAAASVGLLAAVALAAVVPWAKAPPATTRSERKTAVTVTSRLMTPSLRFTTVMRMTRSAP